MLIKYSIQGLLIYAAMAGFLAAFAGSFLSRKTARALFAAAFALALAALAYRWLHVRHVPLQNLFEVFIAMGVAVYPLSLLFRRILTIRLEAVDMLIAAVVLFPAGFVFSADPAMLPPALQSPLFAPHVAVYTLAYIILARAAVHAAALLARKPAESPIRATLEKDIYALTALGFPLLTIGLALGSTWGHLAWSDWWGWDPKEMWSLASWLAYVAYLHFRATTAARYPRANAACSLAAFALILLTLFWANLSQLFSGLHSYAT